MNLSHSFTFADAVKVFPDVNIKDLRNYVARGLLKHVGPVPDPGREREFSRLGLYELGVVRALAQAGSMPLTKAAALVGTRLDLSRVTAIMSLGQELDIKFEDATRLVDRDPTRLICFDWEHRDLNTPALWVMVFDNTWGFTVELAEGWEDVPRAAHEAIEKSCPRLLPSVAPGTPAPSLPPVPDEYILRERPFVSVFNLTAVLVQIDEAIERNLQSDSPVKA